MKKQLELTMSERIILPQLLPQTGNILTMTSIKDFIRRIDITKEEAQAIDLKFDKKTGMTTWDPEKETIVAKFDIADADIYILKKAATQADESGRVTVQSLDLINKLLAL